MTATITPTRHFTITTEQLQAIESCLAHLQDDPTNNAKYEIPRIEFLLRLIANQPKNAE